ncbi:MAG: lamin tail domain-containing protein [Cytophagaceae bacterium]
MRILMILCLLTGSGRLWSQVYTFDSTLPNNISGTRDYFQLSTGEVQLNAPTSNTHAYLNFPVESAIALTYEMSCTYDVEPSSTNMMSVLLNNSTQDTFIEIRLGGESGSNDKVEVRYTTPSGTQSLWKSTQGIGSTLPLSLRITCSTYDHQHFHLAISFANGTLIDTGDFSLPTKLSVSSLTWDVHYTSTRTNKYRLQQVSTTPLFACVGTTVSEDVLLINFRFSQAIMLSSTPTWESTLQPSSYEIHDSTLTLTFAQKPSSDTYMFDLSFLRNSQNDTLYQSQININIEPFIYPGILRITELMSDPEPSIGLPNTEYIELYHTGTESISIHNWNIVDNGGSHTLPDFNILPQEVIILAPIGKCSLFTTRCIEWNNFPTLNNDEDFLSLYSATQLLIDSIHYVTSNSDYRSGGGYPWIRKNIPIECSQSPKLEYPETLSITTPGSVETSTFEPEYISSAQLMNDSTSLVQFNYYVQLNAPFNASGYQYSYTFPLTEKIKFGECLLLPISFVTSCRTNITHSYSIPFILPRSPSKGDLYFTEVLPDAEVYASEFIELTNVSSHYVTLAYTRVLLTSGASIKEMILPSLVLPPGEIIAFCADSLALQRTHAQHGNLNEVNNWQSIDDKECTIKLLHYSTTLDSIVVRQELHSVFQTNTEGWSLEKIDTGQPVFRTSNWITAPDKGSPGLANHFHPTVDENPEVYCSPCHLQTNQPTDNHTTIHLPKVSAGSRISISINTLSGIPVHHLVSNEPAYSGQNFLWRGEGLESGSPLAAWYVAQVQLWDGNGDKKLFRVLISTASF